MNRPTTPNATRPAAEPSMPGRFAAAVATVDGEEVGETATGVLVVLAESVVGLEVGKLVTLGTAYSFRLGFLSCDLSPSLGVAYRWSW